MQGIDHGNPHFIEWEPQAQRGVAPCPRSYLLVKPLAVNNRSLDDAGEAGKGRGSWSHLVPRTPHTTGGLCRPVERGQPDLKRTPGHGRLSKYRGVCPECASTLLTVEESWVRASPPLAIAGSRTTHVSTIYVGGPHPQIEFWFLVLALGAFGGVLGACYIHICICIRQKGGLEGGAHCQAT